MKRMKLVLLMFSLFFSLTACGGETEISQESSEVTARNTSWEESTTAAEQDIKLERDEENNLASSVLVVYFSRWGNTDYPDDVDATTSASIVTDENTRYGTTEYVADMIAKEVHGDLYRIETVTLYTADFDELRNVNHDEMNRNYLPELKESNLDISGYDTVFVGYPVWATDVPQAVLSFLNEYDLSGKTVIPFCTHDGYGAGRSYQTIADASHGAVTLDGIAIEAKDVLNAQGMVADWLTTIGVFNSEKQTETAIMITVGDITYCEAHHNMAIFYAQTDNPNLSVDVIPIGRVTSDLNIFDNLGSREEITFSLVQ